MRRLGFLIIGLLVVAFFARPSDEEVFWRWFITNQEHVFRFEADKERVLDEILAKLRAYRNGLVFEISIEKNGIREFIISADGLKELLPSVTKLVSAAPTLQNWKFVAFRPRLDDYAQFSVEYAGQIQRRSGFFIGLKTSLSMRFSTIRILIRKTVMKSSRVPTSCWIWH